jgi:hypothetical protein
MGIMPTTVDFDRGRIIEELNRIIRQIMGEELKRAFPNKAYQQVQAQRLVSLQRMIDLFAAVKTQADMDVALYDFQALLCSTQP